MSPQAEKTIEDRVARLEQLLDRAIARARLTAAGRAILAMLGLQ
jgi:hypothetical protein